MRTKRIVKVNDVVYGCAYGYYEFEKEYVFVIHGKDIHISKEDYELNKTEECYNFIKKK